MSEFSPAQLDALEDALEDLEALGVPPEAGVAGGPEVARRLDDYREILRVTRNAMPTQEVKPGLLDGVIAEAHAAVRAPAAEPAAKESWWKRFRMSLLLPGLAVAGGAALVLVLIRPAADEAAEPALAAQTKPDAPALDHGGADEKPKAEEPSQPAAILEDGLADASVDKDASRGRLRLDEDEADRAGGFGGVDDDARADAAPPAEAAAEPEPEPEPEAVAEEEAQRKRAPRPAEKIPYQGDAAPANAKKSKAPSGPAPSTPPPAPAPEPKKDAAKGGSSVVPGEAKKREEPADNDEGRAADGWATISAADKLRRAGGCASARSKYNTAVKNPDAKIRARGLAGLGLCALEAGDDKGAEAYFTKARKADPDVAGFIRHERSPPQADPQSQSAE